MANPGEKGAKGEDLSPYAGRWLAIIGGKVISQGGTPQQALNAAKNSRIKETPSIEYVPTIKPLRYIPSVGSILTSLPPEIHLFLVGGAVRDAILHNEIRDLDFIVPENGLKVGRDVADRIGAAYYPLDKERKTGRVIQSKSDGSKLVIDFTVMQGSNLVSDLRARDFTINSIAVDVKNPYELLDPLSGMADIQAKILRVCTPKSFISDPIRIIRGIRLAAALDFRFHPQTRILMRKSTYLIPQSSPERLRDEFFRILDGPQVAKSILALDVLDALQYISPELLNLKGVIQSPPHHEDAWHHSIQTVDCLSDLLNFITYGRAFKQININLRDSLTRDLNSFMEKLREHITTPINSERSLISLLTFAALNHDIGKSKTIEADQEGEIYFYGHESAGAGIINHRSKELRLSNIEIARVTMIVRHHMRPLLLAQSGEKPSRRAIYRFFKETGPAGVDICILAIADTLATFNHSPPTQVWENLLCVVHNLLVAWFNQHSFSISPDPLITGNDIIKLFGLHPGPIIGELLEVVREAQVEGSVRTKDEAIATIYRHLNIELRHIYD